MGSLPKMEMKQGRQFNNWVVLVLANRLLAARLKAAGAV